MTIQPPQDEVSAAGEEGGELDCGLIGADALAVQPRVDGEHDIQFPPGRGSDPGKRLHLALAGDAHAEVVELGGERGQARSLAGVDERVGDEHLAHARGQHGLGFAELGAGQPARPGRELHAGDRDHLVGLDVRTELDAMGGAGGLHPVDVGRDLVAIDENGGGG